MADGWLRITAKSPSEELTGLLAEGLLACGGTAIEEQDGALVTYVPVIGAQDEQLERIREIVCVALGT